MRPRVVVLVAIAVVLVALLGADRIARPEPEGDTRIATSRRMPTAAPTSALASTWFCAGGTGNAGGIADSLILITNSGADTVNATVTVVGTEGEPAAIPVEVPKYTRVEVRPGDVVPAPYVAATVDLSAGGVAVERYVTGPNGLNAAPCASSGSQRWYFADGSTAREDTMLLALYNPFPEDAIVDLSFATDQGRAVPSDFQGIVVKGGRLNVVNVGDHVRRRDRVAASVTTRSGRVVADRIQVRNGGVKGMSVALGAPSLGDEWWFPEGFVGDGVTERFSVYNPSADEAIVSLELTLEEGAAEPFDLTIPPRSRVDVNAHEEERVPKGVAHSAVVRSLNDVPVMAERSVAAVAPSPRIGTSEALGGRRVATDWLLSAGVANDGFDEWVTVVNPAASAVRVSFTALADGQPTAIEGLQDVEVAAGRRIALRLTEHIKRDALPLRVEATGRGVVLERAIYGITAPGIALSAGIPMR